MREATVTRTTTETDITLTLTLDGSGQYDVQSGVGFLDHMLALFARHGNFDLQLSCKGDVQVDAHHSTEDIALCLGMALRQAAGDCRGITRYGHIVLPMDDALVLCAVDFGGRDYLGYDMPNLCEKVGCFDTELVEEFLRALCRTAGINLHLRALAGTNTHHLIEAAFKALGRVLRQALRVDDALGDRLPTTKGVL